ncbi:MAG: AMP-binding protein [Bacillota bacterium]|nr:AMP-binding protein [Bacillota bacterium]
MTKKAFEYKRIEPVETLKKMLDSAVSKVGDQVLYKYRDKKDIKEVTYKEFQYTTFCLGTGLASLGLASEHVACTGENSYPWICVYLTMMQATGVFVPIDKELPLDDVINIANDSDSKAIFYASKFEEDFKANKERFNNIKYFIGFDREEDEGEFLSFNKLIEKGKKLLESGDKTFTDMETDHYGLKLLVYTSGTTGNPKGVMLSEHNLVSSVYYGLQVSQPETMELAVLPLHHTYEAVPGILVGIHHHSTTCINSKLTMVLKNIQEFKPDYLYLVPAFVELFYKKIWAAARESGKDKALKFLIKFSNALMKFGIDKRRELFKSIIDSFGGNLKTIICGGAPVRAELGYFFDSIGIYLMNGYGITECSPLVAVNNRNYNDCTTVGFPLPCLELKFDNINDDGIGEICVKGDVVMMGYYKQPEKTEEALKDGWFYTGDYGRLDKAGRLVITGRKKNIIVLNNGKNVYPEEIEDYIGSIDYIKEVVVYALLDEHGQQDRLCAEIYLDSDIIKDNKDPKLKAKLKADIDEKCKELPRYKQINEVVIRDTEFEKTTSNKIRRNKVGPNAGK